MPITTQCQCGKKFAAKDELAGKRVQCPECGAALVIATPAASASSHTPAPAAGATELAASPIAVTCACGKRFQAPAKLAGQRVKCPSCSQPLAVPSGSGSPAVAASPAASSLAVKCTCGKSFTAKPQLAGKTVRCPACSQPVKIPDPTPATNKPAPPAPAQPQPAAQKATGSPGGLTGLLDEIGLEASRTGRRCPKCKADIDPHAVLCVECGYHLDSGKQLQTKSLSKENTTRGDLGAPPAGVKEGKASKGEIPPSAVNAAKMLKWMGILSYLGAAGWMAFCLMGFVIGLMAASGEGLDLASTLGAAVGLVIAIAIISGPSALVGMFVSYIGQLVTAGSKAGWVIALILAIFSLPAFPLGTVLGVLLMVALFDTQTKRWCDV